MNKIKHVEVEIIPDKNYYSNQCRDANDCLNDDEICLGMKWIMPYNWFMCPEDEICYCG